ncbi:MAG: DNA repair protein RecN [Acidiferrobacterales bacterium]
MLTHLFIRNFTIVPTLELAFEPGFTVLTGETGAGKSIVIDALTLALGDRAESGVIRDDCDRAEVTVSFALSPDQDAAVWLDSHDLFDEQECLVRRVVEIDKPSKGFINGRPVPMQMLRELGQLLVDVHGQHEHQSLLRRHGQRQILDDYAGLGETLRTLGQHYHALKVLQDRADTLRRQSTNRTAHVELLRYQVRELEALDLNTDEVARLEEEHARLANGAELLAGAQDIARALYDDEDASISHLLARAVSGLEHLAQYDPKLGELTALLNEAAIQVDETASQLHHYLDALELDPQRLQWIDQRLTSLHDLARKHQVHPEALPEVLNRLRTELDDLEDVDLNLGKIEQDISNERESYFRVAETVSAKRRAAARRLSKEVTAQMQHLGMAGGMFEVHIDSLPDDETSTFGLERVEFRVSTNAGQALKTLSKVASGGELSRISLALQVVTARVGRIPTLIFDEVDVGIGGRVAEIVGQQLRKLGQTREVLCITHLAQVAALGDHHVLVSKSSQGATSATEVRALSEEERVSEIARMIGGIEISKQTLAHAHDMLARASNAERVPA